MFKGRLQDTAAIKSGLQPAVDGDRSSSTGRRDSVLLRASADKAVNA